MNESVPEIHLKEPGFIYNACGSFTKNKERIEKIYVDRKFRLYIQK